MSRGRGRGRGTGLSFNVEAIGFARGDALPTSLLQPSPKYPPLKKCPVSLLIGEDQDYLLALQKEFQKTMKNSPYFIREEEKKSHVDRYSDKYRTSSYSDDTLGWEPDWRRFPSELKMDLKKKRKVMKRTTPNVKIDRRTQNDHNDVIKKLEAFDKKESEKNEAEINNAPKDRQGTEDKKESDVESEIEELDEEEEEENDYLTSYFDNGESYLDEEEDNLDEKEGGIY